MRKIYMWGDKIINREIIKPRKVYVITCEHISMLEQFNESIKASLFSEDSLYLKGDIRPFFILGYDLMINGKARIINSKSDFITAIKDSKTPVNIGSRIFTKNNIELIKRAITALPGYEVGFEYLALYIESRLMTIEHNDCDIVINDRLGLTNDILLAHPAAHEFDSFKDFLISLDLNIPYNIIKLGENLEKKLFNKILDTIEEFNSSSISVEIKNNKVMVTLFASPMERRYYIALMDKEYKE